MILDLKIAAIIGLILLLCFGVGEYVSEREARLKAEIAVAADQKAMETIKEHDVAAKASMDQLLAANADLQKQLNTKFQAAQSPQDIATLVAQIMALKQPVTFVTPPPTKDNPNPQPVAQVPIIDAPQVKAYVEDCESCKLNLSTTQAKLTYAQQQVLDEQQALKLQTDETAQWKKAAKGTFWGNSKRDLKWAAIGGAIAIALAGGAGRLK